MDRRISSRFVIIDNPTDKEMEVISEGLRIYVSQQPYGELDIPYNDINLVLRDHDENVVGGVITSMKTGVMHLEVLWIDEKHRGLGYGRDLVLEAERIGKDKGYTASQTWTFSFQGPEFYKAIGYKIIGICDVYPDNIKEFVFVKRLDDTWQGHREEGEACQDDRVEELIISEDKSEDAMKVLDKGLGGYVNERAGESIEKYPGFRVKLVIKDDNGQIIGGLSAFTAIGVLHVELMWINERFRGQGLGRRLLTEAEKIAKERGAVSGLTWVLSFNSPEFFQKCGYEVFEVSDGYPDPIKEYYLKKKF
jgi:GNAT superfamily N-acetyltransferase